MYPYQPFQQPYQPAIPSMPQSMPIQTTSGISGHLVGSHEEIQPNDVPMNGTAAYFPTQDGSVIYAKQWNPNGSITTIRYVPALDEEDNQPAGITLQDIVDQLNDIQDMLKKPARKTTTKKVSDDASD